MAGYYSSLDSQTPFGQGDPTYNASTAEFIPPVPPRKRQRRKPWIIVVPIIVVIIIAAAVVGGVVASRKHSKSSNNVSSPASISSVVSSKNSVGRFATATDSEFLVPIYPSTTNTAVFTSPTFLPITDSALAWPKDPFQPAAPDVHTVRPDRPRLIAPAYKWAVLPNLIKDDPYLRGWNDTIFGNASVYYAAPPVQYFMDGPSGILDNAREIKMRVKAFAYVYRMTNDTKWVDRCWEELQNAGGPNFGPADDKWNSPHFLDVAELTAAFAIGYDWLHDVWTSDQRDQIRATMIKYGLNFGVAAYSDSTGVTGWWRTNTQGNWNCVCNSGLTLGSLAILEEDTTGVAAQLLGLTVDNAKANCANAVSTDGTWAETANYWYFGTTGHAEMSSALLTATGSDYGLTTVNSNFQLTGLYHMFSSGATSQFNYGDHGPNKFSTTANSMMFYGEQYHRPEYILFQREQFDAAEPWSMFWYDPTVSGAFWDGLALDHYFDNALDQWAAMRSSWTDIHALYVAMKAGKNQGHQTHNDLDCGDFVFDALGTRWAGELGSADYRAPSYFGGDAQDSPRWLYYRKRTEGQNTILVNQSNQNVLAAPSTKFDSSGTTQGSSTVFQVPRGSTAYFTMDMTSAYFDATSVKRGVRMINQRKQLLIQDEINAQGTIQWRMHTNATVTVDASSHSAKLELDGQTMDLTILNPPDGVTITTTTAVRFTSDPTPPAADQENPGVTVVVISLPAGTHSLQVLFNPHWPGMSASDFVTPSAVSLDSWSLTSHP